MEARASFDAAQIESIEIPFTRKGREDDTQAEKSKPSGGLLVCTALRPLQQQGQSGSGLLVGQTRLRLRVTVLSTTPSEVIRPPIN